MKYMRTAIGIVLGLSNLCFGRPHDMESLSPKEQAEARGFSIGLFLPARHNNRKLIEYILKENNYVDPSYGDYKGDTPLHEAAAAGSFEAAQSLLKAGAYVSIANDQGETPIDLAHENGHKNLAMLLENNAKAQSQEAHAAIDGLLQELKEEKSTESEQAHAILDETLQELRAEKSASFASPMFTPSELEAREIIKKAWNEASDTKQNLTKAIIFYTDRIARVPANDPKKKQRLEFLSQHVTDVRTKLAYEASKALKSALDEVRIKLGQAAVDKIINSLTPLPLQLTQKQPSTPVKKVIPISLSDARKMIEPFTLQLHKDRKKIEQELWEFKRNAASLQQDRAAREAEVTRIVHLLSEQENVDDGQAREQLEADLNERSAVLRGINDMISQAQEEEKNLALLYHHKEDMIEYVAKLEELIDRVQRAFDDINKQKLKALLEEARGFETNLLQKIVAVDKSIENAQEIMSKHNEKEIVHAIAVRAIEVEKVKKQDYENIQMILNVPMKLLGAEFAVNRLGQETEYASLSLLERIQKELLKAESLQPMLAAAVNTAEKAYHETYHTDVQAKERLGQELDNNMHAQAVTQGVIDFLRELEEKVKNIKVISRDSVKEIIRQLKNEIRDDAQEMYGVEKEAQENLIEWITNYVERWSQLMPQRKRLMIESKNKTPLTPEIEKRRAAAAQLLEQRRQAKEQELGLAGRVVNNDSGQSEVAERPAKEPMNEYGTQPVKSQADILKGRPLAPRYRHQRVYEEN